MAVAGLGGSARPWERSGPMPEKPFEPSLLKPAKHPRQTAEDAQKFLAAIVKNSEDAIIGCSPDGTIVSWNRAAQKLFGYSAEEVVGHNIVSLTIDEEMPAAKAAIQRMRRGETVLPFDGTGVTKDRRRIEVSCSASPVKDADGTLMGVAAIVRDIAERKRADEARALVAAVVEFSEEGIIAVSLDKRVLSWNRGAEAIYGFSAEEILGKPVFSTIIPPEGQEEYNKFFARVVAGETLVRFESERRRNDGNRVDVAVTYCPVKNPNGDVIGVSAIVRDITQAKATQQALNEANENYRALIHTIPDVIWMIDSNEQIKFLSPNTEKVFGYSPAECYARGTSILFDSVHPDEAEQVLRSFQLFFQDGSQFDMEFRIRRKDGEWR